MADLRHFYHLSRQYSDIADFAVVYITEAHANDMWFTLPNNIDFKTAQKVEDRLDACKCMVDLLENSNINSEGETRKDGYDVIELKKSIKNGDFKIFIDDMNNKMSNEIMAYPERFCVLKNGKLLFKSGYGPIDYHMSELDTFLSKLSKN